MTNDLMKARWIAQHILPHEGDVRAWIRRSLRSIEVDDLIQETYCRIARLPDHGAVQNGRAYFFATAKNVAIDLNRRARVVRMDALAELEMGEMPDDAPSPERATAGRHELRRVAGLIENLPGRCQTIFKLHKIEGLTQREIAKRLGLSENVVEKQVSRGLRLILASLENSQTDPATAKLSEINLADPKLNDRPQTHKRS
ncbi:RNA polymerase sigma factor [Asticcacaulis sp. ZE23SCel15]|jgi:RNA polymerase sigma-70 factor (ECF subfamily)|uniref:RNA polymerase sigma factor n=1 Tax=Asticcacaulis sp. ZE23SCel15 TaxID=3059027 RepID=UPI00265EA570|nr:RNA polymerase sigma factor [Asticcacaulis sp. ZE23SCel15]WKL56065.1 RNA polymerase sigma factor [Asticcacaulis sp. ZE23SCel15]